uniref:adenylate/guanylate cyclase domain-containing protein n=1 Tax=Candidatus Wunengus californicus TaxID=3367619 RepID=UPI0040282654
MSSSNNPYSSDWYNLLQQLLPQHESVSLMPPFLQPPKPITSISKDLKLPLTKKWNPFFHASIRRELVRQTKQNIQRIRNITNGLTMPRPVTLPIGCAKKMVAAILFFDLENFTAIASKLNNEIVLFVLNTIIPGMMHIVKYWNGEIEKTTGDGIMAIFGTETRNNFLIARDAIEAAMTMRYIMLNDINPKFVSEGLPVINFRIGIEMDEVLVSRIGIKNSNFLTVVGGAANLASKLQTLSGSNGICIGENVYRNLNPLLHNNCREGKSENWKWTCKKTRTPYRFFHYDANWPEPKEWIKTKL